MRLPALESLDRVLLLPEAERERLLSRMGKRRIGKIAAGKLGIAQALALQLEDEDQQLDAWRRKRDSVLHRPGSTQPEAPAAKTSATKTTGKRKRSETSGPRRVTLKSITPPGWQPGLDIADTPVPEDELTAVTAEAVSRA